MSLVRKVFSDSSFTAIRMVFSIIRGLAIIPIITKLLGTESYGIWITVMATVTLLSSAGGAHLHGSLVRFASQESSENQTYSDVVFLGTLIAMALSFLVASIGVFLDVNALLGSPNENVFLLPIVVGLILFSKIVLSINMNFPRSRGNIRLYELLQVSRIGSETLLLVIVFLLGGSLLAGFATLAAVSMALNLAILAAVLHWFELPRPNPNNFGRYIRYGFPMIPKEISRSLLANSDKYLLLYFLGPAAVGIYSVAEQICRPIRNLTDVFNATLYPTISEAWDAGNFYEIQDVYKQIFRYYSILGIPAMFGAMLLAEPLLMVFTTQEVAQNGAFLVPIFIVGYFLHGYDNPIRYVLTSAERTDVIGGAVVAAVLGNIILNLVLIPRHGMAGAAFATLVALTIVFGLVSFFASQSLEFVVPWKSIGRSFVSASVMGVVISFAPVPPAAWNQVMLFPLIGCVVYFAVLLSLGEFSRAEIDQVLANVKSAIDI